MKSSTTERTTHATGTIVVQSETGRFAQTPEWVIRAKPGANALALYGVLWLHSHFATGMVDDGTSRAELAEELEVSVDTIDRAVRRLEAAGALVVHRRVEIVEGRRLNRPNVYQLKQIQPAETGGVAAESRPGGSRKNAARGGRTGAARGSRKNAALLLPVVITDKYSPSEIAEEAPQAPAEEVAASCPTPPAPDGRQEAKKAKEAEDAALIAKLLARPHVERLLLLLADLVEANGSKRPNIYTKTSVVAMESMMRLDGRTPEEVEKAIRWSQGHEFWRSFIMSASKLREKYDTLRLRSIEEKKARSGQLGPRRSGPVEDRSTFENRLPADEVRRLLMGA